jgi:hypothetical protein
VLRKHNLSVDDIIRVLARDGRLLAARAGNGDEVARTRHLFRDFIDASAGVTITDNALVVRFQKRAHNPLLSTTRSDETDVAVPWLRGKTLALGLRIATRQNLGRAWWKVKN